MTAPCSPALQEVTPYSKGLCPPGKQTGNYKKVVFVKRTEKHFKLFICIYLLHGRSMLSFIKTKESHEVKTFVKTKDSYVRTMESYEVCQLGHHLGHLLELIETSPVNTAEPTVQAAQSCNSCCFHIVSLLLLSFLFLSRLIYQTSAGLHSFRIRFMKHCREQIPIGSI